MMNSTTPIKHKITVEFDEQSARTIVNAFEAGDANLAKWFKPFVLRKVQLASENKTRSTVASKGGQHLDLMDTNGVVSLLRCGRDGVRQWNEFRQRGESIPNLSNANLSRCDLIGVDLRGACLLGTFMGGSDLDGADLSDADLRRADLPGCRLYNADLRGADLRGANLFGAYIRGANFTDVDLRGTHLASADLSFAVLRVIDLRNVEVSMRRLEKLPLDDDLRHRLAEILQKLDILDDLSDDAKREVAARFDDLIKELLQSPPKARKIAELQDVLSTIAPPLTAEVSNVLSF